MSGGKTRDAKARRKMSENSLSRPPIPIFSKFQSGLMIVCRASLVLALPANTQQHYLLHYSYKSSSENREKIKWTPLKIKKKKATFERKEYSWDLTATFCTKEALHDPKFVFSCYSSQHVHIKWGKKNYALSSIICNYQLPLLKINSP